MLNILEDLGKLEGRLGWHHVGNVIDRLDMRLDLDLLLFGSELLQGLPSGLQFPLKLVDLILEVGLLELG